VSGSPTICCELNSVVYDKDLLQFLLNLRAQTLFFFLSATRTIVHEQWPCQNHLVLKEMAECSEKVALNAGLLLAGEKHLQ